MNTAIVRRFFRGAPVTAVLCLLIVAVWIASAIQNGSLDTRNAPITRDGFLLAPLVTTGEPLRLLSNMFIHLDIGHMAVNTLMIALIGRELERSLGSVLFLAVYLVSGLGASYAVVEMSPLTPTAGASGALYGLMAVLVGSAIRRGGDIVAPLSLVGVNLAYTFLSTGVSLWGHLGGLLTGAVLAGVLLPRSPKVRGAGTAVVGAVVLGLLARFVENGVYPQ
ncbi:MULTISPECIES: rhomboid family intramembrane serine protease [unclassified Corynebacterium]|uniref:rhomboid family intramembrane serine protease n=1 Tax=unclassified Corynebacterium TaxID=2624378 RepID=UPI0029CA08D9|nr:MULTISPECIES: rhomboid family intramembrane serine protease [unclassified Corynebacterium]WPF66184.1 rhomboid family intramembrane serine protease [Corynebacterium sp. 22KM0430]WPF68676.1 rhomboid family intramembrane serine protease [Corynebacterium sp. 21KM1197]